MNILVDGGAGYIGSGLLIKLGEEFPEATITSLDNLKTGDYRYISKLKKDKRYRLLEGDIRKKADIQKAVTQDTKIVIHLAAIPGAKKCKKQPKNANDTNVYGTYLLLEEAVNHNVERFIFTSSAAVYGTPQQLPITENHPLKPINLYGVTKVAAEKLLNIYHTTRGLTTTTLRLSNVYGLSAYTHWETVIPKFVWQAINDQSLTIRADGKHKLDYVHVQDVIDAVIQCIKTPKKVVAGEIFNIGNETLSVSEIADIIIHEAQKRLRRKILKAFTPLEPNEIYALKFIYAHKKALQKLGYKSKRAVSFGISELFNYALKMTGKS